MDCVTINPGLTPADRLILRNLADDIDRHRQGDAKPEIDEGYSTGSASESGEGLNWGVSAERDAADFAKLKGSNEAGSSDFEPTVCCSVDAEDLPKKLPSVLYRHVLQPYVSWARKIVRHETDVVMLTHLILYFTTSLPSAALLFYHFTYVHGVVHFLMQLFYMGTYTLMMHQHIHMRGILAKRPLLQLFDNLFPYITDPLMGHTWNTYYYHHVKHHHVEGNGPDDLSSTVRYQRDDVWNFLHYLGRFFFFIWLDLPIYFLRKRRPVSAAKAAWWELSNYAALASLFCLNRGATVFALLMPLALMRVGMMVGNWGQHAFVDADEPDSDYRSSVTLIDVASNRYSYNDGYHTSHHLNPLRHWRDHPVHFLQQKETYSRERAIVFHNIDYLMLTITLLRKDYLHLAKCLVPIGDQIDMTIEERAAMLRRHTRRFTEKEIREKFGGSKTQ